MTYGEFDGQQEGEVILARLRPDSVIKYLSIFVLFIAAIGVGVVTIGISQTIPNAAFLLWMGLFIGLLVLFVGYLWINFSFSKAITYVTDRRVIRFEAISPFIVAKRALFWNEALKAKGYQTNLFFRLLGIGFVQIEPQAAEHESITIRGITYYEDLANYIDKILFTFKNNPSDVVKLHVFVHKPRGERYT